MCPIFFIFHKKNPLKNYEICFLFYLQRSFGSRNIQIFVSFLLFPLRFNMQSESWNWIKWDKTSKFEWMLNNIRIEKIILAPILATKHFLEVLTLLLDIVCCNLVQYQGKIMMQNDKNPNFGPSFFHGFYLYWYLALFQATTQCNYLEN